MAAVATGVEERLLIGGEWVEAGDGRRFDVTDPGTGEIVGSVPDAGESDVAAAIDAAAAALDEWKAQPALNRARILRRAADLIRERRDRIALVMTSEQGKPLAEAAGEVDYAASFLEWFGGEAERVYGQVVPPMNAANRVLVLRQPVGVTAAITPWNFPAAMMTRKLGPAMAAGCTSIVKPASATPLTAALDPARDRGRGHAARRRQPDHVALGGHGRRPAVLRRARAQDLVHGLDRGRQGPDPALGRPDQAAVARARWPRAVHHLRRRRSRRGGRRADRVEVPQRRPDVRVREPHLRAERHLRRLRQPPRREGHEDGGRARDDRRRHDRPDDRRARGRQVRRARAGRDRPRRAPRRRRRAAQRRRVRRRVVLRADGARRRHAGDADLATRRPSARSRA